MEFLNSEDKIKIEGPPEESEKAREQLDIQARDLVARMSYAELSVDAKYHKHIIGKGGANGERKYFGISSTGWHIWSVKTSCRLGFGMLHDSAWAVGSNRYNKAAETVGTKSTVVFNRPDVSPCIIPPILDEILMRVV